MAFLQKQKNLGDLYNLCEAQTNLGLKSMAYQSKNFVTINDGNIHVSSFGLKSDTVQSNYVLMATDSNGNAAWRQFTVADWLYKPPDEILLSSFSNDQKFVSETILEATVQQQITELSSTIIGDSISVSNMNITNFVFNPPIIDNGDGTTTNLVDFPCVLTNDTSNVKYSKLIQTYSNNSNVEDVCSSKAVYNLYKYVESIENMQIENTLNANNNLNELQNADLAVRNLGLNDKLNTSNLITHNITNTKTVTNQTVKVAEDEFVLRDVATGDFKYKPIQFSTSLNNPSPYIFVNTASISNLYNNNLLPSINTKLTTSNVLSEFFENQVLTDLFKERLYQIGIQEVAFSCNYEHLMNKPRDVGSLCNNMGYISSFSNLLELNKVHARSNLQISTVGHTGKFEDLILPLSMSNIFMDENLRNFPGIPFYVKDNFFNELSNSVGKYMARSNLGLGTMSTQNQSNVEILGGTAILEELDVGHEFSIKSSNSDIVLHSQSNDYHFLKCVDDMGKAEWAQIPFTTPNDDDSLCVRGLTFLTNNLHYNDSNYAISAWAISNVFNNNDRIANLVPIATKTKLGIVQVSSNYLNDPDTSLNHLVFTVEGASNLYSNVSFTIETLSNDLTTTIETLSNDLTTTIETLSNDVYTEITYTKNDINQTLIPNINQRIKTITYSNIVTIDDTSERATLDFITTSVNNDDPENKTLNIQANFYGNSNKFLCDTGRFEIVTKTTLRSNHDLSSKIDGDIIFTGNVEFKEDNVVHFPETVLHDGDGISISGTTITNTGVRNIFDTSTVADITDAGLYILNNTIINTGVVEVDTTSRYLEVIPLPIANGKTQKKLTMNFNFSDFQRDLYSFYFDSERAGDYYGFVKQPTLDKRNSNNILAGDGSWIDYALIQQAVTRLNLQSVGDVLYLKNNTNSELRQSATLGEVTLSFSNADPGQVLTYGINDISGSKTYDYTWSYIHENAYRAAKELKPSSTTPGGQVNIPDLDIQGSNFVYNADGVFRQPGNMKDFSVIMTLDGCNLNIFQNIQSSALPIQDINCNVLITHQNIGGLPENYLERQYIWDYQDHIFTIEIAPDLSSTSVLFEYLKTSLLSPNSGETVLNANALIKYIDLFRDDIILKDDTTAFDDTRCLSAKRTSNYMSNVLFNHICLNEDYDTFDENFYYDPNITYDIRNQCITPYTLSNFAYKHLVAQKEKTTNTANPHNIANETKVITGGTLSNYVQEQIIYDYNEEIDTNINKFVRGSNLIKFNDENRWASNVLDAGVDRRTDLNDNVKFITPRGTRQIQEIDLQSDANFDIEQQNQIVTGYSLSNYVHEYIIYNYNEEIDTNINKFVRGSNLIKFNDDNRWASNDVTTNLNDNEKFITPRGTRKIQEIDLQSTDNFDNSAYSYQIVTGHSLSNYVRNEIKFNDKNEYGNELDESSLMNRFEREILHYNNYPTALTIKKYLDAKVYMNYHENVRKDIIGDVGTLITDYLNNHPDKLLTIGATSNLLYNNYGHGIIQNIDGSEIYNDNGISTVYDNFANLNDKFKDTTHQNKVLDVYSTKRLAEHICRKVLYNNKYVEELLLLPTTEERSVYYSVIVNYFNYKEYFNLILYRDKTNEDYNPIVTPKHLMHVIDDLLYEEMQTQNSNNIDSYTSLIYKITSTAPRIQIPNYATGDGSGLEDFYGIVLHSTIRDNDKMFVTPKLLHEYVSSAILFERMYTSTVSATIDVTEKLEVHNGDSDAKLIADHLYIRQKMWFFHDGSERTRVEGEKQYMTIESTGEIVFKQIEYLSGHTSNIVREDDKYSMVTGLMTQTSYSNQFVCGMYNHSNTVYVRNGYHDDPPSTNSVFVVGTGTNANAPDDLPNPNDTANGLEVHTNGEVYVRSNLILGDYWRLSFTNDELSIEKFDDTSKLYIQKHVFN